MAATAVTLNDLEGRSPVAGLLKCNPSNICAAFYMISSDSVLVRSSAFAALASCSSFSVHINMGNFVHSFNPL